MNNPVDAARRRLTAIEQEAEKLKLFISAWEGVADLLGSGHDMPVHTPEPVEKSGDESERLPKVRAVNPPSSVVIPAVIAALKERGHPMSRSNIHEALKRRGLTIQGTDPVKTLGTILWRAKEDIIQLEGYGYWPRGLPYSRANYLGDLADLLGPAIGKGGSHPFG